MSPFRSDGGLSFSGILVTCAKKHSKHTGHTNITWSPRNSWGTTDLLCERFGGDACLEGLPKIQNHVNDRLIADRSIDHRMVNRAVRPFDVEILLDEIDAFPINGIHEQFGFFLTLASS